MNCTYCNNNITGLYMRDDYGNCAHREHAILCSSCGQFVTSNDLILPDGRPVCIRCLEMAVLEKRHVKWVMEKVLQMFQGQKLDGIPQNVPIELVDYKQMLKLLRRPPYGSMQSSAHQYGLTISRLSSSFLRTKWEHKIYILNNLHRVAFAGVLAHELFHVWQNEKRLQLRPPLCEGLCNLGSHLMYNHINNEISQVLSHQIEKSPDPIYGGGFRIIKAIYDHNGGNMKESIKEIVKLN